MHFTWDDTKRRANLGQHGFDFVDVPTVFAGPMFTFEDNRFAYGEQRFITLGLLRGLLVVIAHTEYDDEVKEDIVEGMDCRRERDNITAASAACLNEGMESTASSIRCAPASGSGSCLAFGF